MAKLFLFFILLIIIIQFNGAVSNAFSFYLLFILKFKGEYQWQDLHYQEIFISEQALWSL